jgi:hypothetical protein
MQGLASVLAVLNLWVQLPEIYYRETKNIKRESCQEYTMRMTTPKQGDRKVTQPIPGTSSVCQKINYVEIKQYYIKCRKCLHCSAMHAFTLFLLFDTTR